MGPKCSDFCNEALDLIENGLFQIDPSKRFTCTTVHDKLQTIYFRSIINPDYCTKSTSTSTVRQTKRATSRGSTKIHEAEGADTMEISKNTTTDEGKQAKTALATENTITSKGENMAPTTMLTNMTDGIERDETPTATSDNKAHTVELAETVTGPNNVQSGDVRQPEKTAAADPTVTKPGEKVTKLGRRSRLSILTDMVCFQRQPRNVHDA